MSTENKSVRTWSFLAAAGLLMGCGSALPETAVPVAAGPLAGELQDAEGKPAPKWVTQPSRYEAPGDAKVVCGEGSITGTRSISMAQTASVGRARTALARTLELKVVAMLKDYQATTSGGELFGSAGSDEQHAQDASRQVTSTVLSGTETAETWISGRGTMHSLVCLDTAKFKDVVEGMRGLDERLRAAIVKRADKAFAELDEVEER